MSPGMIRPAQAVDIADLVAIEIAAGQLFHSVGMPEVAAGVPDMAALARTQEDGRVWVASEAAHAGGYIAKTFARPH